MPKPTAEIANERRSSCEGKDELSSLPRPLSLQMGPTVIFLNACGDPDAVALTEEWKPKFTVVRGKVPEFYGWQ